MLRLGRPVNGASAADGHSAHSNEAHSSNGAATKPPPEKAMPEQLPAHDDAPGVCLDRLLCVAILTPRQATTVAAELFAALAALHSARLVHGAVSLSAVRVGTDGVTRLGEWPLGAADMPASSVDRGAHDYQVAGERHDLEAAYGIVTELARNIDRPVFRHGTDAVLLTGLTRMSAGEPLPANAAHAELHRLARSVNGRTAPHAGAHQELAALVSAANRQVTHAAPEPSATQQHNGSLSSAHWSPARRRRMVWIAGAILVATSDPGRSLIDRVLHRSPTAAPTHSVNPAPPPRTPHAVPAVAPVAAGVVRRVVAHPVGRCAPGANCRMQIAVHVRPAPTLRRVDWRIEIYNRCTGARTSRPGGLLVVRSGARFASGSHLVHIPDGRALALTAHTTRPSRAEAAPVLVPAAARSC
jgi:hypothetical protein